MSDGVQPPAAPQRPRRTRGIEYLILFTVIGGVIAAAFYQEQISSFFKLRMWDRDAPGREVVAFLKAAQRGDQKGAEARVRSSNMQPLTKNGKWAGYFVVVMSARMDILMEDFVPKDEPKPSGTEFKTLGSGAAIVTVPNASGQPVQYRLEMKDDGWKITDIRGGRPAPQQPPVRGASREQAFAPPR